MSPSGAWGAVPACTALRTGQRSSFRPRVVCGVRWGRVFPGVSPPARIERTATTIIPRVYTATRISIAHFHRPCTWCSATMASNGSPLCGRVGDVHFGQLTCLGSWAPSPWLDCGGLGAHRRASVRGSRLQRLPHDAVSHPTSHLEPLGSAGKASGNARGVACVSEHASTDFLDTCTLSSG